jgi:transcriptional regulator with XRE-family HTH domain
MKLTALRTERGMNKSDLARAAGVSLASVCQIELGRLRPPPGSLTLQRIARALDWPEDQADALLTPASEVTK